MREFLFGQQQVSDPTARTHPAINHCSGIDDAFPRGSFPHNLMISPSSVSPSTTSCNLAEFSRSTDSESLPPCADVRSPSAVHPNSSSPVDDTCSCSSCSSYFTDPSSVMSFFERSTSSLNRINSCSSSGSSLLSDGRQDDVITASSQGRGHRLPVVDVVTSSPPQVRQAQRVSDNNYDRQGSYGFWQPWSTSNRTLSKTADFDSANRTTVAV